MIKLKNLLAEADVTAISMPGQKEAGNYFDGLIKTRKLETSDMYLSGTGCYKISGWNSTYGGYDVAFWGIVMKPHVNFPYDAAKLPNPPLYFTAQYMPGTYNGAYGDEPGSKGGAGGTVQFPTTNYYTEGGWSTTNKHWTKVMKISDAKGKLVTPVLSWGPSQMSYGPGTDNFKKMVNALPDKQKLLTNFCTNQYDKYLAVVPDAQKDLYTCPTKKP